MYIKIKSYFLTDHNCSAREDYRIIIRCINYSIYVA